MKATLAIIIALICLGPVFAGPAQAENQAFGLVYTDPTVVDNGDGTYSVTITGLVGTGMMCPAEIMDQEQTYLGILSQITIAQGQGNVLTLSSPQSNLIFHQSGN